MVEPFIRVNKFFQKLGNVAQRDPETGERLLDKDGKLVFKKELEDWVSYSPIHSSQFTAVPSRVRHLKPKDDLDLTDEDAEGMKHSFTKARWQQIEPAYKAWKAGHELPATGTPLAAWAGIAEEQAEILRMAGFRSVEEVAGMGEGVAGRVRIPDIRGIIKMAQMFVAAADQNKAAEIAAAADERVTRLEEQLAAALELLNERKPVVSPTAAEGEEEIVQLRAECDRLGIKYHHKHGADSLRELLNAEAA